MNREVNARSLSGDQSVPERRHAGAELTAALGPSLPCILAIMKHVSCVRYQERYADYGRTPEKRRFRDALYVALIQSDQCGYSAASLMVITPSRGRLISD